MYAQTSHQGLQVCDTTCNKQRGTFSGASAARAVRLTAVSLSSTTQDLVNQISRIYDRLHTLPTTSNVLPYFFSSCALDHNPSCAAHRKSPWSAMFADSYLLQRHHPSVTPPGSYMRQFLCHRLWAHRRPLRGKLSAPACP